jgi:hypothetical protein
VNEPDSFGIPVWDFVDVNGQVCSRATTPRIAPIETKINGSDRYMTPVWGTSLRKNGVETSTERFDAHKQPITQENGGN